LNVHVLAFYSQAQMLEATPQKSAVQNSLVEWQHFIISFTDFEARITLHEPCLDSTSDSGAKNM